MIRLIRNGHASDSFLDESQINLHQLRNQKLKRCIKHPEHDPYDYAQARRVFIIKDCLICRGIHYGIQPAGSYEGESVVRKEQVSMTHIWFLSLAQFGLVRQRLHFNHFFGNGPKWSVNMNTLTVFINAPLSNETRKMFEEWGCKILENNDVKEEKIIFELQKLNN